MLETALNNASTATEVAALQAALTAAQEDISAILASNNVYTGDLNIRNAAELTFAKELGGKVAIINGNVTISVVKDGLAPAEVSAVTKLIKSVVGNVTVSTIASLDLSGLTAVSGAYSVSNNDVDDSSLSSTGDLTVNYNGAYSFPSLVSAGSITLTNKTSTVTGTTSIDFSGLTTATDMITAGATTSGTLSLDSATDVKVGSGASIISLTAAKALNVELHNAGTLSSLAINTASATTVVVKASKVTGSATITATSGVSAPALTTAAGITAVSADVSFPALTSVSANTSITAATADLSKLATVTGTLNLVKTTNVALPALTSASGNITANNALAFVAGSFASTVSVTTASATTVELASISSNDLSAASVETLKFNALKDVFNAAGIATVKNVIVTGKTGTTNSFTTTSANTALASATFAGELEAVSITGLGTSADKLASLSTSGSIDSFTLNNSDKITSVSLNHSHISGGDGSVLIITNNDKLASLKTSTNYLLTLTITGNTSLTSLDASSYVNPVTAGSPAITISGNKLSGNFVNAVPATATTAYTEAVITSADLLTLRPYVVGTTSTVSTTLSINLESVTVGTGTATSTLSAVMYANEGDSTVIASATSTTTLDTVAEFALVKE